MDRYEIGEMIEDPASGEYGFVREIQEDGSYRIFLCDSKTMVTRSEADLELGEDEDFS
jgi:hypothetical protein